MLDFVKRHLKVTHSLEDELISDYIEWSTDAIVEAVHDKYSGSLDMEKLKSDTTFKRALVLLTTFYYENRLTITEVNQSESPFGVLSAIQSLRANKKHFMKEVDEDEA